MSYSGQAAQSFSQGLQQGYGFVDQAVTNKQNRELKQQEASRKAALHTQQLEMNNQAIAKQGYQNEGLDELSQELKQSKAELRKLSGIPIKAGFNRILGSDDVEGELQSFMAQNKDNPAMAGLGINSPESVRIPNGKNTADRRKVLRALSNEGGDFSGYTTEEMNSLADSVADSGLYVEADGIMVNLGDLSAATGALGSMSPQEKKAFEAKKTALEEAFTKVQTSVDTREELKVAQQKQVLQDKITAQATQLAGKPAKAAKQPTKYSMLADWEKANPNASNQKRAEYALSIDPKQNKLDTAKVQEYNALVADGMDKDEARKLVWKDSKGGSMSGYQEGIRWAENVKMAYEGRDDLQPNEVADLEASKIIIDQTDPAAIRTGKKSENYKVGTYDSEGNYNATTQREESIGYTIGHGGDAKKGKEQQIKDSQMTIDLERNQSNLTKLDKDIASGKFRSGLGVKQWNDLINRLPESLSSLSIGEADEIAKHIANLTGMTITAGADVKGALSDMDMKMLQDIVGNDGNLNPKAISKLAHQFQEKQVSRAEAGMVKPYQSNYKARIQALSGSKGTGITDNTANTTVAKPDRANEKPVEVKDYSYKPGASKEPTKVDPSKWRAEDPVPAGYYRESATKADGTKVYRIVKGQ